MWWSKLPFLQRIEQAARSGFPAVEFWPWQNKDINGRSPTACQKLEARDRPVHRLGLSARHERSRRTTTASSKTIEAGCQVAKQLNCKMMTVVGGDDIPA